MKDTKIDVPEGLSKYLTFKITMDPLFWEAFKLGMAYTWGAMAAISLSIFAAQLYCWLFNY